MSAVRYTKTIVILCVWGMCTFCFPFFDITCPAQQQGGKI